MISYAGVRLYEITEENDAEIVRDLDPAYSLTALRRSGPGDAMDRLAWSGNEPEPPAKIGVLRWPAWGACRWAEGLFICGDAELAAIRQNCYPGGILAGATWTLDDGSDSVSATLYMLPPRPIYDPGISGARLWLLNLVDERYLWWHATGQVVVNPGTTTWTSLFGQLASAVGATLTIPEAIDAAYLKPPPGKFWEARPLPVLIDAAAVSVGLRLCRGLDGVNTLLRPEASWALHQANLALASRLAGGHLPLHLDQPANVPRSVTLAFPRADGSYPYTSEVTLDSLALPQPLQPGRYFSGTRLFRTTAVAEGSSTPANAAELDSLAALVAEDYYLWRRGSAEARYEGAVGWVMEGLTGVVEYAQRECRVSTRVSRPPELEHADQLLHLSTAYPYDYTAQPEYTYNYYGGTVEFGPNSTVNIFAPTVNFPTDTDFDVTTVVTFTGAGTVCFEVPVGFDKSVSWGFVSYDFASTSLLQVGPFDAPAVLMSTDGSVTQMNLSGVEPINTCDGGQMLLIVNDDTTYDLTIYHEAGATVTSRFDMPNGADMTLVPSESRLFWYDLSILRWRPEGCVCDPGIDEKVKVTASDTTPGYLFGTKLTAGTNITLTVLNPGGDESLEIAASGGSSFSGARVYHSTSQSISAGSTTLNFDSERFDVTGYHDNATNNTRLTAPATGYYSIGACVSNDVTDPPGAGEQAVRLVVNGTTDIARQGRNISTADIVGPSALNVSTIYHLTAGDYVEVVFVNDSGSGNTQANGNYSPEFWMHFLGS